MTQYQETPIEVWIAHRDRTEECSLGQTHIIRCYVRKRLGPVIGSREHDNGYERRDTDLRQDRQGRTYHMHVGIDYSNNISWWRDGDNQVFYDRPQFGGRGVVAVDVLGRLLPGPAKKSPARVPVTPGRLGTPGDYVKTCR